MFFLVPLVFTSKTSELFEFNKMVTVYVATIIIVAAWVCKMIAVKKIIYRRTFMEIPLLLYLLTHVLSTIFSIDTRTSIFGYYSRFHEGLLATISYLLLYFAAVSNLTAENVKKILYSSFVAGIIIAVWGAFEHYGHSLSCVFVTGNFDVACWVQDVRNRVYATLGQPNWMAAYLDVLILVALGSALNLKFEIRNLKTYLYPILATVFFTGLLFTKSQSGIWGLLAGTIVLLIINLIIHFKFQIVNFKLLFVTGILFLATSVLFGLPLPRINGLSLENYFSKPSTMNGERISAPPANSGYIDIGISTSSDIRKVVWEGALKVWQRYPVFGSGVETFAFSYYKDRPAAHNMLSEWDFLYNKAHNEVLNLLATTGTVGIVAYFLLIIALGKFLIGNFKILNYLQTGLAGAYLSILVTNFLGFSVVIIGLFFFLIPAFIFLLSLDNDNLRTKKMITEAVGTEQWFAMGGVILLTIYLISRLVNYWQSDTVYALGQNLQKANQPVPAFQKLQEAVAAMPEEPLYRDELAQNTAVLALAAAQEENATLSSQLANIALKASDTAVADSPNNVVFLKSRARVLYSLSQLDPKVLPMALEAILKAVDLAPTDAKIHYFAGLLLETNDKIPQAIKMLEETRDLKIDYRDARFHLAKLYLKNNQKDLAKQEAEFIINRLGDDEEVKKWLVDNKL